MAKSFGSFQIHSSHPLAVRNELRGAVWNRTGFTIRETLASWFSCLDSAVLGWSFK